MATIDLEASPASLIPYAPALQAKLRDLFTVHDEESLHVLAMMDRGDLIRKTVLDHLRQARWSAAGEGFRSRLDAAAWPRGAPWKRPLRPGALDFWHVHAHALDQLDELLGALLPHGARGRTELGSIAWIGSHPDRPETVQVCLLTGRWHEPATGRGGPDLISLVAYLTGQGQGQAARWLARFCKIEGRRYA